MISATDGLPSWVYLKAKGDVGPTVALPWWLMGGSYSYDRNWLGWTGMSDSQKIG